MSIAAGYVLGRGAANVLEPAAGYWPVLLLGAGVAIVVATLVQELGRRSSGGR